MFVQLSTSPLRLSTSTGSSFAVAAAAAKSLQLCPTLCDPIDGSQPGSPVPGILQARTLEWVAISFSNAWKWKVKVKSLSRVRLLATPWTAAHQASPSMGFSRQEYWSGLPLPSPKCWLKPFKIKNLLIMKTIPVFSVPSKSTWKIYKGTKVNKNLCGDWKSLKGLTLKKDLKFEHQAGSGFRSAEGQSFCGGRC